MSIDDSPLPYLLALTQSIIWDSDDKDNLTSKLLQSLPLSQVSMLRSLLDKPGSLPAIKKIVTRHPEWLPIETWMRSDYSFRYNARTRGELAVDVFAARMDTGGPKLYLYFLGDYDVDPFCSSGEPTLDLEVFSRISLLQAVEVAGFLPKNH